MPYNPRVQHKYGEYMGRGIAQAGEYEAQGILKAAGYTAQGITGRAEGIAGGISSAGSSIGSGIAKAGQQWTENKAMLGQAHGKLEAWNKAGLISGEDMDSFAKIRDPNKLSGAVAVQEDLIQNQILEQRQRQNQITNYALDRLKDEAEAKSNRIGQPTVITDPITGQKQTYVWTNPGQITRFEPPGKDEDKTVTGVQRKQVGPNEYIYLDQSGRPVPSSSIRKSEPVIEDERTSKLKRQRAEAQGAIAEGNVRPGPDWLPFTTPYKQRLQGIDAELQGLGAEAGVGPGEGPGMRVGPGGRPGVGGPGVGPAVSAGVSGQGNIATPGAGAAGGTYKSKDDVKAAMSRGELTREQALKILREQFGM